MVLARLMAMVLVALTIVFVSLWFYARTARRDRLEAEWDRNRGPGRRESFVKAELAAYEGPLRRRLILWVYVIPGSLIAALIYFTTGE
jgi:hypothetical protein